MLLKPAGLAVAFALLAGCASDKGFHYAPPPQTLIAPEAASGWTDKQGWQGLRPIRWQWMRATRSSGRAAAPWMPPSPCNWY